MGTMQASGPCAAQKKPQGRQYFHFDFEGHSYVFENNGCYKASWGASTCIRGHVMLVQHHDMALRVMAQMLRVFGCHLTIAGNSSEALFYFKKSHSDLVICDLNMPGLNGYDLCHRIKRVARQTRTLITTACCQAEIVSFMMSGVVDGWLFKPFRMCDLRGLIIKLGMPVHQIE